MLSQLGIILRSHLIKVGKIYIVTHGAVQELVLWVLSQQMIWRFGGTAFVGQIGANRELER